MKQHRRIGIGVDVEEVSRFRILIRRGHRSFFKRFFTARELRYCHAKADPAQHLAARFCAKEAIAKALLSIGEPQRSFAQIEVRNRADGAPEALLHPGQPSLRVFVSLSHTRTSAIAFAVVLA